MSRRAVAFSQLGTVAVAFAVVSVSSSARGDVTHVVARGHTVEAIAHRYHVTVKAVLDRNHLTDPRHLKVGDTLTIPGVTSKPAVGPGGAGTSPTGRGARAAAQPAPTHPTRASGTPATPAAAAKPVTYAMRPKTPGAIHAARLATSEDFTIRVSDRRGRLVPAAAKSFERMLRSSGNVQHPVDPRLITLVGAVSNHFGSRKIEVISGFRPFRSTQFTAHSNHNVGKAIDFRVVGVPNEVLRDFCRTFRNVGVGYYPNSTFVHLDVRTAPAFWIDFSKPGETPRYNSPSVDADEGTSDVGEEVHTPVAPAPDSTTPQAPATVLPSAPAPSPIESTPPGSAVTARASSSSR